ncbi:MAG TPA: alpha/beta fold hydrolase [Solirubrobacteraceae bacterium]|nr:alpha/beta fold hydrolase [Solirubrobacteraceae bacterium]
MVEQKRAAGIAYREALPEEPTGLDPVLCVHGFPESSFTFRHLLPAVAATGRRAIAFDLPGYGDSSPDPPGTWERHVDATERFRNAVGLDRAIVVVHDWGGLIGLRWGCDHADAVSGLVISNTGFFPDGEWSRLGRALQTEGQGEALIDSVSRDGLAALLGNLAHGIDDSVVDEYWKAYESPEGRRGMLELFRSGDLEKLEPYEGRLAALGVPTLVIWGENEEYTPTANAERFGREIPHAEVVMIDDAGHFLWDDAPEACSREVVRFLSRVG